ncbi:MAG: helix-turn-helix domain-containing protein [Verrucomicrobiota bacterium]
MEIEPSVDFSKEVVARLKRARVERGWSQAKLAEVAGVSRTGVTMIESNKRNPTLVYCHVLARALDLTLSDVIREVE